MGVPFLDLKAQHDALSEDIARGMARVMSTQQFILGPVVEEFERAFAASVGSPHGIGVASGTDALLLTVRALGLDEGAEVVVPSFTFFATAGAVWNAGAVPVFADVDAETFNLTADTIERVLTPRTAAIVVVHLYGQMAPMREIMDLARARGLRVIEDVAQAQGARQAGFTGQGGSIGNAGAFSFFPTKILGAFGDAGAVTSGDDGLADRVRKLRVHGGHKMYHHDEVGTNSRLDALQAGILAAKLPHVAEWIGARQRVAQAYDRALQGIDGVQTPVVGAGNEHVYGVYTLRVARRDALRDHLRDQGIGSNIYYPLPLHLQECFKELGGRAGDLPVTERLAGEVLSLPIFPTMSEAQIAEVADAVRGFFRS